MASSQHKPESQHGIVRGANQQDPAALSTFVLGRIVDPVVQYGILARGLGASVITRLGGTVLPSGPSLATGTSLDSIFGLSPYRSILLGMSVTAMLKQNIHATAIMQERLTVPFAAEVGLFNLTFDSLNSLFFVCAQTSASTNGEPFPQTPLLIGSALFAAGITIELLSETQRHFFKKDPANKGKVYQGGLFKLSRHVNYFGYTLWRAGYAIASGGYIFGAVVAGFFATNFLRNAIPELQSYLEKRYGVQYEKYKKDVPYAFVPYVI